MPNTNRGHQDFIPVDELEEREFRRTLLAQSRAGNTAAQAKLLATLYGVTISTQPTET